MSENIRTMAKKAFGESTSKREVKKESRDRISIPMDNIGGGLIAEISDFRRGIIVSTYSSSLKDNIYEARNYNYEQAAEDLAAIEDKLKELCRKFEGAVADLLIERDYI